MRYISVVLLAAVLAVAGCASSPGTVSYADRERGFAMAYPAPWQQLSAADIGIANVAVAFATPAMSEDDFRENVNVYVEPVGDVTLDEYTAMSLSQLEGSYDIELIESSDTTFAGMPGHSFVYTTDNGAMKLLQVFTVVDETAYVVTYVGETPTFPAYLPEVAAMIDSFEIGAVPTPEPQPQQNPTPNRASTPTGTAALLVGTWRAYSEAVWYDAGGNDYLDTATTRTLAMNADGTWAFGTSSGTWSVSAATDADWTAWATSPYGPTEKVTLDGWNQGTASGPIESGASRVDFFWVIYRKETEPPGQIQIKFGHTAGR